MSIKLQGYLGLALGTFLILGFQTPVSAIEEAEPGFGLWEFDDDDDAPFARLVSVADFFPNDTGIEIIGINDSFEVTTPNSNDDVRTVTKSILEVRNVDTGALVVDYDIETQSGFYPNPAGAEGMQTTYFCGFDEFFVDPLQEEYPCEEVFGFGFANVGTTRLFIVGNSLVGAYSNASDGFVDVSRFRVQGFNLKNGNLRWQRSFRLIDSAGWEIAPPLSAVGDFLDGDGADEVRIVQIRDAANDALEFRYRYYDAKFGDFIKTTTFVVPAP